MGKYFYKCMEKYFCKRWRNIADQGNMQAVLVQAATIAITGLQIVDKIPATFGLQGGDPHNFDSSLDGPTFFGTLHFLVKGQVCFQRQLVTTTLAISCKKYHCGTLWEICLLIYNVISVCPLNGESN